MNTINDNSTSCGGWLRLDRSVLQSFVNERPESLFRYVDLLSLAVYQDTSVILKGTSLNLRRGDLAVTTTFLARRWGVSRQSASRFLQRLIKHNLLACRKEGDISVYIIGSEAIENHCQQDMEAAGCEERCIERYSEECADECSSRGSASGYYGVRECGRGCGKADKSTAETVAQYNNKEKRINKSVVVDSYEPTENFLNSFFNTDRDAVGLISRNLGVTVGEMKELAAETLAEWRLRGVEHNTELDARSHLVNQLRVKATRKPAPKSPKNDWKRRRGQYTTAKSWQDYDEPFT